MNVSGFYNRALLSVFTCVLLPTLAAAHTNDYEDFYNLTQGKGMSSDSGCRIVMCMLNPKGPLADKKCQPDIKTMYREIALAFKGHGFIPMCQGFSGVSMEQATNTQGKSNGAFFHNEMITAWRWHQGSRWPEGFYNDAGNWELIYKSDRTHGYMPINGTTHPEKPVTMWNGTQGNSGHISGIHLDAQGDQRQDLTNTLLDFYKDQNQLFNNLTNVEPQIEDLMAIRKRQVNVFTNTNTQNINAAEYDLSVVASLDPQNGTQTAYVTTQQPNGAYFKKGDKVIITRFTPNRGDLASYKKASNKYGVMMAAEGSNNTLGAVQLKDPDGKTIIVKIPQANIDTTKSTTSYTYTDDTDQIRTLTPIPVGSQGQVSYVDNNGQTQTVNGQTVDNIKVNGQAFFEIRPGSSTPGRSNEYIVNIPGIDDESPNRTINALDAIMPAE